MPMNKYKKLYIAIAISLLVTSGLHAQLYMGIEAGVTNNFFVTNNAAQLSTNYNSALGMEVGLPLSYQCKKWFALQADLNYTQKNYKITRTGFYKGIYQNNTNSYIQLPILANFSFGGSRIRGFMNIGLYGAYWMSSKVKGVEPNILNLIDTAVNATTVLNENSGYSYNEKYQFSNIKDNRFELGWLTGVGISYTLKSASRLFVEARFTSSLTDQQKQYQINQTPRYNDTYGISVGYLYKLDYRKKLH